jgi:hypothetical protein
VNLPRVGPVDPRRVTKLRGDREEELAQQEDAERPAQPGANPQRLLCREGPALVGCDNAAEEVQDQDTWKG